MNEESRRAQGLTPGHNRGERVRGTDADRAAEEAALTVMRRVRARLVTDHPFFGDLALRLNLRVDRSCRDLWTDGRTLAFNPVYATAVSETKLLGAQAHEVLHIVLGHNLRRRGRDRKLWNRACDMAVNALLLDAGFALPDGFILDPHFAGCAAEEIYAELLSRVVEAEDGNRVRRELRGPMDRGLSDGHAEGRGKGPGMVAPNDGAGSTDGRDQDMEDRVRQEGRGVRPVTGGRSPARGDGAEPPRFDGEVRDLPDVEDEKGSREAHERAERDAEVALARAVAGARRMGVLPAGLERVVEKVDTGILDWRDLLRRFLANCADNDYTWTSPNRRFVHQDIYMPSRWEQRLKHVAVAVDTSGSVDRGLLSLFMTELGSVLDFFDTELTVVCHDTKVQSVVSVSRADFADDLVPVGGGGTDFRTVPGQLAQRGIEPSCLLWFSDLECDRFPEEPGYPVLWLTPDEEGETPPFGERVVMRESSLRGAGARLG